MSLFNKYSYRYPHAAVTADCVIFGVAGGVLKLLLIERGVEPFKGMWALPGGFMRIDETIEECAARELFEETGLKDVFLSQFHTFSRVDRDPRERVVTVAFVALVQPHDYRLVAGDDASNALWFDVEALPPLAFDHYDIIQEARKFLAESVKVRPVVYELLERNFTLSELQGVYEAITGESFDRRNFQRKVMQSGAIERVDDTADAIPEPGVSCFMCCESVPDEDVELSVEKSRAPRRPAGRPAKNLFRRKINIDETEDDADGSHGKSSSLKDYPFI